MQSPTPLLPHLVMNMAMTLDGKVSTIDRTGAVFTSHHDKQRMAQIRARADALIMGATTVAIDTPRMLINTPELRQSRTQHGKPEQPIRVILSATGSLRPDARPFSSNASPILVFASNSTSKEWRTSIETAVRPSNGRLFIMGEDRVPLRTMLEILYSEYLVRSAVCEGGPTLNFFMFQEELVDELYLTIAPLIFGGASAKTPVDGPGFPEDLTRHATLKSTEVVGDEVYLHYHISRAHEKEERK